MSDFGAKLRKARERGGHTQEKAAKILGVSASALQKWELGQRAPEPLSLPELMRRLPMLCERQGE